MTESVGTPAGVSPASHAGAPAVSVIIPAFNAAPWLADSIESVLAQTWTSLEVLVVDDGSTDGTAAVAARYPPPVRLIQQPNRGQSAARNLAISAARGRWVAFLDADDTWHPRLLEEAMARFQALPEAALVCTGAWYTDGDALILFHRGAQLTPWEGWVFRHLLAENFVVTSTVVARKECVEAVGGFDDTLSVSEDFDLWIRMAVRYPFGFVPRPLALHRSRDEGAFRGLRRRLAARRQIFRKIQRSAPVEWLPARQEMERLLGRFEGHLAWHHLRGGETRRARALFRRSVRRGGWDGRTALGMCLTWLPWSALAAARTLRWRLGSAAGCVDVHRGAPRVECRRPLPPTGTDSPGGEDPAGAPAVHAAVETARPRVLFVTQYYPPLFSGAGLQAARLAVRLRDRGVEVTVLTRRPGPDAGWGDSPPGIKVMRVPRLRRMEFWPLGRREWAARASQRLPLARADLVHFHGVSELEPLLAAALAGRWPVLVKLAVAREMESRRRGRWERIRARLVQRAARVVAISERILRDCVLEGVPARRLLRVNNGVDLQEFHAGVPGERAALRRRMGLPEEGALITSLGRISERKRQKVQVRALARLSARLPQLHLVLGGPTDRQYSQELMQEAAELGVAQRIRIERFGGTGEVADLLRCSDAFTLTSRREGQPNALLEAMACGLPVVAGVLPGITDELISDGANGRLLRPVSPESLAAAWEAALSEEGRRMGAQARRFVEQRHDLERIADTYARVYCDLLDGRRRGVR